MRLSCGSLREELKSKLDLLEGMLEPCLTQSRIHVRSAFCARVPVLCQRSILGTPKSPSGTENWFHSAVIWAGGLVVFRCLTSNKNPGSKPVQAARERPELGNHTRLCTGSPQVGPSPRVSLYKSSRRIASLAFRMQGMNQKCVAKTGKTQRTNKLYLCHSQLRKQNGCGLKQGPGHTKKTSLTMDRGSNHDLRRIARNAR